MVLLLVLYFNFVPGDFYPCMYCTLHRWGPVGHDVHVEHGCHSTECIKTRYLNLLANKGKSERIAIGCSTAACSRCFDFFSSTHKQLENSFRHLGLYLYLLYSACCRAYYQTQEMKCCSVLLSTYAAKADVISCERGPGWTSSNWATGHSYSVWLMLKHLFSGDELQHLLKAPTTAPVCIISPFQNSGRLLRVQRICFARICKGSDTCTLGNHLRKHKIECETLSL